MRLRRLGRWWLDRPIRLDPDYKLWIGQTLEAH
jgi:hypothetical protein